MKHCDLVITVSDVMLLCVLLVVVSSRWRRGIVASLVWVLLSACGEVSRAALTVWRAIEAQHGARGDVQ